MEVERYHGFAWSLDVSARMHRRISEKSCFQPSGFGRFCQWAWRACLRKSNTGIRACRWRIAGVGLSESAGVVCAVCEMRQNKARAPGWSGGAREEEGGLNDFYKCRRYSKKAYLVPRPFSSAPWYSMAAVATSCTAMPTVSKMVISWSFSRPGFCPRMIWPISP